MGIFKQWKWGGRYGLHTGRPVIYGESLFDLFEGGKAVFGGAPFNVAWHLKNFELNPLFITRVGKDGQGRRILEFMERLEMDMSGVQLDKEHATGQVHVSVVDGHPTYHIVPNRAFDYIDSADVRKILKKTHCSIFYHGSLITRSKTSRETLLVAQRIIQNNNIFLSLNLRPPWYDHDTIEKAMSAARWCKLSVQELDAIPGCGAPTEALREQAAIKLRKRYNLSALMVTLGAEGAFLVDSNDKVIRGSPVVVESVIDTVGAGDAFVAVMLLGILKKWSPQVSLRRAIRFAADLCGWSGAVSQGGTLHHARMLSWDHEDRI
ncbi:MAG: PfkB family carbohydrate kinase [Thiohalomonadales bacterium]